MVSEISTETSWRRRRRRSVVCGLYGSDDDPEEDEGSRDMKEVKKSGKVEV